MSFEELVSMLNRKFEPYTMNRFERMNLANLYNKYPEELLMKCIDIGMRQYLRYDENNRPQVSAIHLFLDKLRGILYYQTKPPVIREMGHIECVGWRRFRDWDIPEGRRLMKAYAKMRMDAGETEEEIAEGLHKDGFQLLYYVEDWKEWAKTINELIDKMKNDKGMKSVV